MKFQIFFIYIFIFYRVSSNKGVQVTKQAEGGGEEGQHHLRMKCGAFSEDEMKIMNAMITSLFTHSDHTQALRNREPFNRIPLGNGEAKEFRAKIGLLILRQTGYI